MKKREKNLCPRCGKEISGFPAISRHDNKTEICEACGRQEAMLAWVTWHNKKTLSRLTEHSKAPC